MSVSRRSRAVGSSSTPLSARRTREGDLPPLTLSWYKIGENRNVSGFCTSGELFCLLGNSDNKKEQSRLLKVVSGRLSEQPITLHELRRREAEAVTTQQSMSTNKIASRSRSNTVTRDYHPMESLEEGRTDSYESLAQSHDHLSRLNLVPGSVYLENETLSPSSLAVSTNGRRVSYLEPNDIKSLYNDLTVLETLVFSSQMRQEMGNMSDDGIDDGTTQGQPAELTVLRLLTDMGFKDWAETKVGDLAKWQKRMVLFATEAVAGKDALFFDMPTLDLDAPSALSLITAMQRAAKGGRMVVISMTSLTFREYAMLDKIQLLSSNGSIYFGSVSKAVNYFAGLGRTPSPGASISDFLLDLVDDDMWPGGYSDAHLAFLEKAAEHMAVEELGEMIGEGIEIEDGNLHKSEQGMPRNESKSRIDEHAQYGSSSSDSGDLPVLGGREHPQSPPHRLNAASPTTLKEEECDDTDALTSLSGLDSSLHSYQQASTTKEKAAGSGPGLGEDDDDWTQINLCGSSDFVDQFGLCLWRAFVVRWRDLAIIMATWSYTTLLLVSSFLLAFSFSEEKRSRERFLTMFPYLTTLLLNLWNDQCHRDRNIFTFERKRGYFRRPWMSLLSSLIADVIIYHIFPPLIACCMLYGPVGLKPTGAAFYTFTKTVLVVCMVAACLARALFFAVDAFESLPVSMPVLIRNDRDASRLRSVKTASFTVTLFTLFLFYTSTSGTAEGLSAEADSGGGVTAFMQSCSFYYWGCSILFTNEFGGGGEDDAFSHKYAGVDVPLCFRVLLLQLVVYVVLASLAARFSSPVSDKKTS